MRIPIPRSRMEVDMAGIPDLVAEHHATLAMVLPPLVERLRSMAPGLLLTLARGSAHHAAAYGAALAELRLGLPTAPLALVIASAHARTLRLERSLTVAVAPSGEAADLLASIRMVRSGGGHVLGLVNAPGSPVEAGSDDVLEIGAGEETAAIATRTFVLTAFTFAQLVATWSGGAALSDSLARMHEALADGSEPARDALLTMLAKRESAYVIARGPALPMARELALKLKEVCGIHAEAFSAAEVLHGPIALASPQLPVIVFEPDAATRPSVEAAVARFVEVGSPVVRIGTRQAPGIHPWLQPLVTMHAAYAWLLMLAAARGRDPDRIERPDATPPR
jgi:glutamine---fructose-6-phosphate transaminase (isomerizing)